MRFHLPAETWKEILNWLNRPAFARKMERLWDREFSPIAYNWLHEWHRNVCICKLHFGRKFDYNPMNGELEEPLCLQKFIETEEGEIYYDDDEDIPIADVELPRNITTFRLIQISYLDPTVINFLFQMRPLLSNVHLTLTGVSHQEASSKVVDICQAALGLVMPLITGPLESLAIYCYQILHLVKDYFPKVLADAKLLSYWPPCQYRRDYSFPECEVQCLTNWLFSPNDNDGQPRKLAINVMNEEVEGDIDYGYDSDPITIDYDPIIMEIRKRFLAHNRRQSCSFFIRLSGVRTVEDSLVENVALGEQLAVRNIADYGRYYACVLISCHQINENKERIAKTEQELLDWDSDDKEKEREICLFYPKIGPRIESKSENDGDDKGQQGNSQMTRKRSQIVGEQEAGPSGYPKKAIRYGFFKQTPRNGSEKSDVGEEKLGTSQEGQAAKKSRMDGGDD